MGEGARRKKSSRESALERSGVCIFCGGQALATTDDHCPPRNIFVDRQWPMGFVFPACEPCNKGSSDAESILGFLSWMTSNNDQPEHMKVLQRYAEDFWRRYPREMRELEIPTSRKRAFLRDYKLLLPAGMLHRDVPIVHIPDNWAVRLLSFSKKLTKAVHFHETGNICKAGGDVWSCLVPNVRETNSPIPEEILGRMGRSHQIIRANRDLSAQFSYLSQRVPDGSTASYIFQFNTGFKFICLYGDDGEKIRFEGGLLTEKLGAGHSA